MKKYIRYIAILVVGLVLGYVFFGNTSESSVNNMNVTDMSENANHSEENQLWTCSMHPQIMQPEAGDCPICGMDLIPAETSADGLAMNEIKMSDNAMALANIQTTIIGNNSGTTDNKLLLSGKIMPNEEANSVQASYFEGRIEKLNVNFTGEEVRRGQLLATIYAPTLVAAQQELITAASMKASQPALYNAVRNKLKLWKLSESQINQIESSGKVRENFPIYATVSGTVSQKMAEEGDYVKQGQPIVKVTDLGTVWAMFDAYENQISQLKEGQSIKVTTNAYPNKVFDAKVSFIDPILNIKSRTVSIRATLNNKEDLLKPGMFVSAKVNMSETGTTQPQVIVPATAVLWTGIRSLVYVKTNANEPIFKVREVTLGSKNGEMYTIVNGLENGEEIVTNGTFTVDAAAQLQGKKSMMNTKDQKSKKDQEGQQNMDDSHNMADAMQMGKTKRLDVSSKFQTQLKAVFDAYLKIENGLVKDNPETAKNAAISLLSTLLTVDMTLLKDETAHMHWMKVEKEIKVSTTSISKSTDLKKQREDFIYLSAHLINSVKTFGIDKKVYVDFCPMANNNTGAYWLSSDKEIRNPYFGSSMMDCGSVVDEIL